MHALHVFANVVLVDQRDFVAIDFTARIGVLSDFARIRSPQFLLS